MREDGRNPGRGYVAGPIRWWLLVLGVVLTLTAVTFGFSASVSSATTAQVRTALDDAGLTRIVVDSVDYRDVVMRGPAADEAAARAAISGIDLVEQVEYSADESLAPTPSPRPSPSTTPSASASAAPTPSASVSATASATPTETTVPIPTFEPVLFDAFSADLTDAAKAQLDDIANGIVDTLESHPGIRVHVDGYSDSVGTEEENQVLTDQRAQNVKDYLVGAGVPGSILEATGHAEQSPVASNATEDGRAQNRRVEITITEG
ncbi:OmpA family protein [Demequina capsici]|uniref:OmpA family protein n=1 Tax=Demequina capsici TaxID=3075620 RepID=A0AA96JC75_9MICO|nr:OmpA family protein [Demequina sp. PMTSA13]WNM26521.1 OmpA family protein [Demequina sp. PMTSA13]